MDEKLKAKTCKKDSFLCLRSIRAGRCRERRYADHAFIQIKKTSECTIRSQIFLIFFASGGKGALTPLTKILQTFLPPAATSNRHRHSRWCVDVVSAASVLA